MKLIPAIDLKEGKCVRLYGGVKESSVVYNTDPIKQAKFFEKQGCERIHIVDLDAAFENSSNNKSTILNIRNSISTNIELGGGIRSEQDVSFWLNNGINFLIIGSLAIKNPDTVKNIVKKFPDKIYISLDDYKGKVMINGWLEKTKVSTLQLLEIYSSFKIKGFVLTDVSRDGKMQGLDIKKIKKYLKKSKKQLVVGGGLSNYNDLKALKEINNYLLEGIIIGKAYYLGRIKLDKAQKLLN